VVHFILDDAESVQILNETKLFTQEDYQSRRRWEKITEWNNKTGFFGPDDIIGLGDADEIPSRTNVNLFKHCQMTKPRVDVGIWFPLGNISYVYCPTYIPIKNKPCSFGDPTFWKFEAAFDPSLYLVHKWTKEQKNFPDRMWGTSGPYLLGGMHMSHYTYMPMILLKRITGTEMQWTQIEQLRKRLRDVVLGDSLQQLQKELSKSPKPGSTKLISQMDHRKLEGIHYLPWFYECNRARYPRWEEGSDSRLGPLDRSGNKN
ncbi:MAG: hypothetical protein SGILL_009938, partial [Bacillariaceae sp.]